MPRYNVHSYRQIRVKAIGIEADGPKEAIAVLEADDAFDEQVRHLVNVENAAGPVVDVEYQDGGVPVGWLVDPLDEDEPGHGDGISYDATSDFEPVLRRDPARMPSAIQKEVLTTFEIETSAVSEYDDARNVAERLFGIDPLASAIHRILDDVEADEADVLLDGAMVRIQALRKNIADAANRPDPRIPPGVDAVMRPHGLAISFCESDDEQCDDEIEIRKAGVVEPIGSIQICGTNDFMASTWTGPDMQGRRNGGLRRTAAEAAEDAVALLRRDKWI